MNPEPRCLRRRDLLAAAAAAAVTFPARAQSELPATARVIVGFAPGGAPDIVARRLADLLAGRLARAVVVENRPGAGSRIALDAARQLPPDGLTLLLSPAGIVTTNPHTYRQLNYDPFKDLTPIALTTTLSFGFAVGPAVPASVRDVAGFAAWARGRRGTVAFASPAAGAPPHFVGDWLSRSLELGLTHVPYRGGGPALTDLFGGNVAAICLTLGDLVRHAEAGRLRIIGVAGSGRSPFAPDAPTFAEQGVAGLDRDDWFGLYVGGQAPHAVVHRLSQITREVQTGEAYRKALRDSFLQAAWSTPEELDRRGREDSAHWGPIIRASGFMVDS
jgi:tripartite-type tricarboxylate transporter receptor subunit TctC